MRMQLNLRNRLMGQLFISLGIVLFVAVLAGVPAVQATASCPPEICGTCFIPTGEQPTITYEHKCVPVCMVNGKIIYGYYERKCNSYALYRWCNPQDLCPNNGCELQPAVLKDCKQVATSCGQWKLIGQNCKP